MTFLWFLFNIPNVIKIYLYQNLLKVSISRFWKYYNKNGIFNIFWYRLMNRLCMNIYDDVDSLNKEFINWILPEENKQEKENYMKAIDPTQEHDYICKMEQKLIDTSKMSKDEATVFKVKYLTSREQAELRDNIYKVSGVGQKRSEKFGAGTMDLDTLRKGLKGWSNLTDSKGNQVAFESGKMDVMIDKLPPDVRSDLASHIRGESELDEGEE